MPSRWCPNCGAEYREGFARCADCDVALADAPPAPPEPHRHERAVVDGPFLPQDDTVELLRTNPLEADVIAARLRSEGIPAVVFDDDPYASGPLGTNIQGVRVVVRRGDLATALALTTDERTPQSRRKHH